MKPFRLATVLGLRRHELDRAQADLAAAQRDLDAALARITDSESTAERAREDHWQRLRSGIDAFALPSLAGGLRERLAAVRVAQVEAEAAQARVLEDRARLLAASQRVRALERLEVLHRVRGLAEEDRIEQQALDEAGIARFVRRGAAVLLALGLVLAALPGASLRAAAQEAPAASVDDHAVAALIAEIRAKEAALERRATELEDREKNVALLEQAAAERLVELERIASTVEERIEAWQADNGDMVRKLAKIYAAMPPAHAAGLLEELEVGLATQIVAKMKDKQSAAVLSQISERRALAMSRRVAHPLGMEPASASKER